MRDHASQALPRVVSEYMIRSMADFTDSGSASGGVGGRGQACVSGVGAGTSEGTGSPISRASAAAGASAVSAAAPPVSAAPADQGAALTPSLSDATASVAVTAAVAHVAEAAAASSSSSAAAGRPPSPSSHASPEGTIGGGGRRGGGAQQAPGFLPLRPRSRSPSEDVREASGEICGKSSGSGGYGGGGTKGEDRPQRVIPRGWSMGPAAGANDRPSLLRGASSRAALGGLGVGVCGGGGGGGGGGPVWSPSLTMQSTLSRSRPWTMPRPPSIETGRGLVGSSPRRVLFQQQERMVRKRAR